MTRRESADYVELCRRLKLSRRWEIGDRYDDRGDPFTYERHAYLGPNVVWLPREGDWLEKFREERIPLTLRLMYDEHGEPFWFGIAPETKGLANHQEQGGDPALVLCRLYVVVKHLPALDALAQERKGEQVSG